MKGSVGSNERSGKSAYGGSKTSTIFLSDYLHFIKIRYKIRIQAIFSKFYYHYRCIRFN